LVNHFWDANRPISKSAIGVGVVPSRMSLVSSLDETMKVEDRDLVMVPRGYYPVVVPHGYTSYYLTTMAGPQRVWHFHNDPAHAWMLAPTLPATSPGRVAAEQGGAHRCRLREIGLGYRRQDTPNADKPATDGSANAVARSPRSRPPRRKPSCRTSIAVPGSTLCPRHRVGIC
jgi:hypothetical protein